MPLDLEAEYDNRRRVPGAPAILASWERDAAAYRIKAEAKGLYEGFVYGEGGRRTLDLFAPAQDRHPGLAVVFIHGGYWQNLAPSSFSHLAAGLNARGCLVAIPGYDLCPQVRVGAIVDQIRQACLALLRRGRRLVVAGHSAGGHLAAMMLATDWSALDPALPEDPVPAAYAISGLFDLAPLIPTTINGALGLDEAEARRLSPIHLAPPAGRSLDAVVGGAESGEFLRQSRTIADLWGAAGVVTRFTVVEDRNHFDVIDGLGVPDSAMTARLAALVEAASP